MATEDSLLVCSTCATQFSVTAESKKSTCRICLDPRQYVPPTGQSFTTLGDAKKGGFKNEWTAWTNDGNLTSVQTTPKFGIGQRAFMIRTPAGNVLWDLIAFLDDETIDKIKSLGGLKAIVISHPHYYTTYVLWARTFQCPIYFTPEDSMWIDRMDVTDVERRFIKGTTETILPGLTAIKCGGHFDGSLALHWDANDGILFVADTLFIVPSGRNPSPRNYDQITWTFMYSLPNMIPLTADAIMGIWKAVKPFQYRSSYGAFEKMEAYAGSVIQASGEEVVEKGLRLRMLESMKMIVRAMLDSQHHALLDETIED